MTRLKRVLCGLLGHRAPRVLVYDAAVRHPDTSWSPRMIKDWDGKSLLVMVQRTTFEGTESHMECGRCRATVGVS